VIGRKEPVYGGEEIFAVVVPNLEAIKEDYPGLETNDDLIRKLIKKTIKETNRTLPDYKKISDFTLRLEPFEKTPSRRYGGLYINPMRKEVKHENGFGKKYFLYGSLVHGDTSGQPADGMCPTEQRQD